MTLDVAIATWQPDAIGRIAAMKLPRVEGVRYVVSWQAHGDCPVTEPIERRDDITVVRFDGVGVSANRNNALDHCTADIILIADDDLTFTPEGLRGVIDTFKENPSVEVGLFRYATPRSKVYPDGECDLSLPLPRGYSVAAIEIAVRRDSRAGTLRFNTLFGPGAGMTRGEDEIFLLTALRRGLRCRFFPLTVATHPHESTGDRRVSSVAALRAIGCIIALYYRVSWPLRLVVKARRLAPDSPLGFPTILSNLFYGALKSLTIKL